MSLRSPEYIENCIKIFLKTGNYEQAVRDCQEELGRAPNKRTLSRWVSEYKTISKTSKTSPSLFRDEDLEVIDAKLADLEETRTGALTALERLDSANIDMDIASAATALIKDSALDHADMQQRIYETKELEKVLIKKMTGLTVEQMDEMTPKNLKKIIEIRAKTTRELKSLWDAKDKTTKNFIDFIEKVGMISLVKKSMGDSEQAESEITITIKEEKGDKN